MGSDAKEKVASEGKSEETGEMDSLSRLSPSVSTRNIFFFVRLLSFASHSPHSLPEHLEQARRCISINDMRKGGGGG